MDKITVIIPTYNRARTLDRAINSVLNQSYSNIEVIVIDDNSKDNTTEIIQHISDKRLKYIKLNENKGACFARNLGIENSTGEYIAFQDSDDEWYRDKLEIQLKFLKEGSYNLVGCSMNQIYDNGKVKSFPNIDIESINIKEYILFGNIFSTQTILGKKECFVKNQFDNSMPRFQDWELMIRMCRTYKVGFMQDKLVDAYIQKDSISRNNTKAVEALNIIREKYANTDNLKSFYLRNMAIYSINNNIENAQKYFIQAYNYNRKDYKNKFNYAFIKINLVILIKFIYNVKLYIK